MRRKRILSGIAEESRAADPGKDLFAFLFIIIMVFSCMLLLSTEERQRRTEACRAPTKSRAQSGFLQKVEPRLIGHLVKSDGRISLQFAGRNYHPIADFQKIKDDGLIFSRQTEDGQVDQTLLLDASDAERVSLAEYLETFQFFGRQQINVAFAERVN